MHFEVHRSYKGRSPSKKLVQMAIDRFEKTGCSNHSPFGLIGAEILNYCVRKRISFALYYLPHGGYFIQKGTPYDK